MRFEWAWGILYITMGLVKALPVILGLWSHEVCCLCTSYGFCWKQEQPWWRFLCGHRANPPGSACRSWADIWFIHSTQEHHGWEHHCILHSWNPLGNVLCWARGASWSQNRDTTSPKPAKRAFPGSFLNSFLATCHTALTWQEGLKRRQTEVACRAQCSF